MNLQNILSELGPVLKQKSVANDIENQFAAESFRMLKEKGVYNALIPSELGGGGVSYSELCYFLKELARYCPSTSLTLSMHMHLIAVLRFKHLNGDAGATNTLRMVAEKNLILLSTGGGDWVSSNGSAKKVAGGYQSIALNHFAAVHPSQILRL